MFIATLIGNLGKDCEIVTAKSGNELMKLALGVSQGKDRKPLWVDVLMRNRPNLQPFLVKGQQILVQGTCDINVDRNYLNVNVFADQVQLLGKTPAGAAQATDAETSAPDTDDDPFAK